MVTELLTNIVVPIVAVTGFVIISVLVMQRVKHNPRLEAINEQDAILTMERNRLAANRAAEQEAIESSQRHAGTVPLKYQANNATSGNVATENINRTEENTKVANQTSQSLAYRLAQHLPGNNNP